MAIVLGILTTLLSIGIALVFSLFIGFSLSSLSLFFVIPVGGIAFGALASLGFYYYLKKKSTIELKHYFIGGFLGIVAFIGIPFLEYQMTYISVDGAINYQFEGEHISYFSLNDKPMTFSNYLSFTLETSEMTLKLRRGPVKRGIETGSGFNNFKFIAEGVGFLIGGFFLGFFLVEGKVKCLACRKGYLKDETLFEAAKNANFHERTIRELIEKDDFTKFTDLVIDGRITEGFKTGEIKAVFYLSVCNKCKQGYFIMKFFRLIKDEYVEIEAERKLVRVSDKFVEGAFNRLQVS